jgi:soluble lytic murein transglycosylase
MADRIEPNRSRLLAASEATRELARRRRRRRRFRAVLLGILVIVIGVGVGLVLTGKTVLPVVSAKIYPVQYGAYVHDAAERYGVDPYLVAAVIKAESGYDPQAVSSAGAVGLMQLMPDTADWIVTLKGWRGPATPELTSPGDNVQLGACYLAYLEDAFGGDDTASLAAYNAGEGTVREWMKSAGSKEAFDASDIRFPETRAFVTKVNKYRDLYMRIYPDGIVAASRSL